MFDDPEIDKLIIYALIGICAVLFLAVIILAVKKNTYYIDENGDEIPPKNAKIKKVSSKGKKKPVIVEEDEDDEDDYYEEPAPVKEPTPVATPVSEPVPAPVSVPVPAPVSEETAVQPLPDFEEEPLPLFVNEPEPVRTLPVGDPTGIKVAVKVAGAVTEHTVDVFPCMIGREAASCNLTISEPAVSRRHARFVQEGKAFYIEDVSEHNGTYLNGTKLPPLGRARLQEGDRVNLGRAEIRIQKFTY